MYLPYCLCFYIPTFVKFLLVIVNFWLAQVTLLRQIVNLLPSRLFRGGFPLLAMLTVAAIARKVPATNLEVRMRNLSYRKLNLYVQCGVYTVLYGILFVIVSTYLPADQEPSAA